MTDLTRGGLYRLKSEKSLSYWRGALEGALAECAQIECALGLPPDVHTSIYNRLKQFGILLDCLEEVREDALLRKAAHPAITHCDNCGCDWVDNGLNPVGCPYCKQSEQVAENEALLDALRKITEWPDGGNRYGQENIKRFAQATIDAAMRKENNND